MRSPSVAMLPRICACLFSAPFRGGWLTGYSYGHSLIHFDPKAEARLRLKIDFYVIPTVSLLYLFCFIDRANIVRQTVLRAFCVANKA